MGDGKFNGNGNADCTCTGDDNCAFIGWNGGGKWSDAPCYMRSTCICEKPVTTALAPTPSGGPAPPTTPVNNEALNQNTNSGGGMGAGGIVLIIFNVILVTMIGGLVYVFVIKPRRQPASALKPVQSGCYNDQCNRSQFC